MFMYYDTMIGCYETNHDYTTETRSFWARLLGM